MKTCYIGRIRLSKKDSEEWKGHPPFMYVTKGPYRDDIGDAILFSSREDCIKTLTDSFKLHKHLPSSKMEIMTLSINVENIEEI